MDIYKQIKEYIERHLEKMVERGELEFGFFEKVENYELIRYHENERNILCECRYYENGKQYTKSIIIDRSVILQEIRNDKLNDLLK